MKWNHFLLVFFALFFATHAFAVLEDSHIKVFAVAPDGTALPATLSLHIEPGNGNVWSSVSGPLVGTATQSTEKIAVRVAKNYFSGTDNYDYFFSIDSEASVVDGPSAGSAMALLVVSALKETPLSPEVGLTGTITNTGQVGPVGGVFEKAQEASKNGIKLFMIPEGESRQVVKLADGVQNINLPEYAQEEWGMKVIETPDLDDVLKYAFTNIEDIHVNTSEEEETPPYIPPKIEVNIAEEPLGAMNENSIAQTRIAINEAQNALNHTLLDDSGLIEVLSTSLSNAEKTVNEAELLTQNGYYYSAGNFAFLAKVNAYFVRDVSENPEMLTDLDGATLGEKLSDLATQLTHQQEDLKKTVPIEGFEWYIAAQQRATWAEQKVVELRRQIVVVAATEDAAHVQAVGRVQDYEYARAWLESSQQFSAIALRISTKTLANQEPFKDYYAEYLTNAQNGLDLIQDGSGEDAQRRLDAALIDQENGRHLSAAMNGASALAIINGILIENDAKTDVQESLEKKIAELEVKVQEKENGYAWARLYLDHARYYLNSAKYYQENQRGADAASSLSSGFALALLAENTYEVTKDIGNYYDNLPATRFAPISATSSSSGGVIPLPIGSDGKGSIVIQTPNGEIPWSGVLLAALLFLGIVFVLSRIAHRGAQTLAGGAGGSESAAAATHQNHALHQVDTLEAQLFAAKQGLRHAHYSHSTGALDSAAHEATVARYEEQIRSISAQLRKANLELRKSDTSKSKMKAKMGDLSTATTPVVEASAEEPKAWPKKKKAPAKRVKKK